jgi:hypothetical protein
MAAGAPMLEAIDDLVAISEISQLKRLLHRVAITINPSANAQFMGRAIEGTKLHSVSFHQASA